MKNKNKIIGLFIYMCLFLCFGFTSAESSDKEACSSDPVSVPLEVSIPGIGTSTTGYVQYVSGLYKYGLYLACVIAVIVISFAGFQWVAAGGNPSKISNAKNSIIGAITGLVLVFCSYLILGTINPSLVSLKTPCVYTMKKESIKTGCCTYSYGGKGLVANTVEANCKALKGTFFKDRKAIFKIGSTDGEGYCAQLQSNNLLGLGSACDQAYLKSEGFMQSESVFIPSDPFNMSGEDVNKMCKVYGLDVSSGEYCGCQMHSPKADSTGSGTDCFKCWKGDGLSCQTGTYNLSGNQVCNYDFCKGQINDAAITAFEEYLISNKNSHARCCRCFKR